MTVQTPSVPTRTTRVRRQRRRQPRRGQFLARAAAPPCGTGHSGTLVPPTGSDTLDLSDEGDAQRDHRQRGSAGAEHDGRRVNAVGPPHYPDQPGREQPTNSHERLGDNGHHRMKHGNSDRVDDTSQHLSVDTATDPTPCGPSQRRRRPAHTHQLSTRQGEPCVGASHFRDRGRSDGDGRRRWGWPTTTATRHTWPPTATCGLVEADRFSGHRWDRLVDALVAAAVTQMRRDLRTGQIFGHCARRGWRLHPPHGWAHADHDGIVQESVTKALTTFIRRCRDGNCWEPGRDRTLHDYFTGLCRGEFANIFRRLLTSAGVGEVELPPGDTGPAALRSEHDPARSAMAKVVLDKIRHTTALSDLQRRLLFGHAYGLTYHQLAEHFDTTARAVEGHIHRARRQLRKEEISW